MGTYYQPTLLAYDPEDANNLIAGSMDAGVFLSTDAGLSWRLLTDPFGDYDDVPHLPRPRFAHFDHDDPSGQTEIFVGTQGRGVWRIGVDFTKEPDRYDGGGEEPLSESNDTIGTSTILGSLAAVTLNNLNLHNDTDVDFFKITASQTGKLLVNMFFDGLLGALSVNIRDAVGTLVASSSSINIAPQLDSEQVVIPVVGQEEYFIEVFSEFGHTNCYDLEIENFAAPVPNALWLDPLDDTGMSNADNVTNEDEARIFIEADLADFAAMGIDILTPSEVADGEPGAAVHVIVNGGAVGFATPIPGTNSTLFQYTFAPGELSTTFIPAGGGGGLNVVKAAVRIFDGQDAQANGRTQESSPLLLTLDQIAPDPSTPDMLASSDSGTLDDDNVTSKMAPAFQGTGEPNVKVRVFADGLLVGQSVVTSDGRWEITAEPLVDEVYEITTELEDLAGNISAPLELPLVIEIDTLTPNTPYLDLVAASDSGRNDEDNVTNDNTLTVTMTSTDPRQPLHLFDTNYKFRIFVRPEAAASGVTGEELLLYDSAVDGTIPPANIQDSLTDLELLQRTMAQLPDGVHNLKLEVEDRAGNISPDFLLSVVVDTVAPPVNILGMDPASTDTGVEGYPATFVDRVTSDTGTSFIGRAEANSIVRLYVDAVANNSINTPAEFRLTVADPLDGNDAFPNGQWMTHYLRDLNDPAAPNLFPLDGVREIIVEAEDLAGNVNTVTDGSGDAQQILDIFIDTQGPQITAVEINEQGNPYDLFDPKPSEDGPTPLVTSLVISVRDLPFRSSVDPNFLYEALLEGVAEHPGHYLLEGDRDGVIPIYDVRWIPDPDPAQNGAPALGTIELYFTDPGPDGVLGTVDDLGGPLPDDRFTLTISDSLVDPVNNALDGEFNTIEPQEGVDFPTGDGVPGGDYVARFTVDSRPELGVWAAGNVWVDTNGNYTFDPYNADFTNRDIIYQLGYTSDDIFAGNFTEYGEEEADGFDKLAAYGRVDAKWRWLVDTDNDGVPNIERVDPLSVNGLPVAGNFDQIDEVDGELTPLNGDEVGVFTGDTWYFDINHDYRLDAGSKLTTNMVGYPIVGDFDGDHFDDLGTWTDGRFQIDLANGTLRGWDGVADVTFQFGYIGVRERPVAADMDKDGYDDLGLWVPDRSGVAPETTAEWNFLISNGDSLLDRVRTDPISGQNVIDYTPIPFGPDRYAQFGDEYALPVVGNFDPPIVGSGSAVSEPAGNLHTNLTEPLDVNDDGHVAPVDALIIINYLNFHGSGRLLGAASYPPYLDVNMDGMVAPIDSLLVINFLNTNDGSAEGEGEIPLSAAMDMRAAVPGPLDGARVSILDEPDFPMLGRAVDTPSAWTSPSESAAVADFAPNRVATRDRVTPLVGSPLVSQADRVREYVESFSHEARYRWLLNGDWDELLERLAADTNHAWRWRILDEIFGNGEGG